MKKFTKILILLTLIVGVSSCKKDSDIIIPESVRPYYASFLQEAINHGYKKLNQKKFNGFILTGDISNVSATNGVNAAAYYDHKTKFIFIDTTSFSYKYNREVMIYHELGHAILKRDHASGNFNTGEVKSIMDANSLPNYTGQFIYKRQYYVSELFIIGTPAPWWSH